MVCTTHFATTHLITHTCNYTHISPTTHLYTFRFPFFYMTVACLPWRLRATPGAEPHLALGRKQLDRRAESATAKPCIIVASLRRRTLLVLQSNAKAYEMTHQLQIRRNAMELSPRFPFPVATRSTHTHSWFSSPHRIFFYYLLLFLSFFFSLSPPPPPACHDRKRWRRGRGRHKKPKRAVPLVKRNGKRAHPFVSPAVSNDCVYIHIL